MTRLSSRLTFVFKRVVPWLWFIIVASFIVEAVRIGIVQQDVNTAALIVGFAAFMALFGGLIILWFMRDFVDEVWDCGDGLLIRNKGREERISFEDCDALENHWPAGIPRVTLWLRRDSTFGTEIAFLAPMRLWELIWGTWWQSPLIADLRQKIELAKQEEMTTP